MKEPATQALRAMAHPARLSMLRALCLREHTVSELAEMFELRQPTTSQHLQVLRNENLVRVRSVANRRYYRANDDDLAKLRAFLDAFWSDSLRALKRAAEARARKVTP